MLALLLLLLLPLQEPTPAYDPLAPQVEWASDDLEVVDSERERTIPVRIYLPEDEGPQPVILFSHGLGGSRESCGYLGDHWASRGYVGVFVQHPGSDRDVWRGERLSDRRGALLRAASPKNLILRVEDVSAVIDQLERWASDEEHALHGRLDLDHIGMSGHSFGARTTQSLGGQSVALFDLSGRDDRIDAALAMSPSRTPGIDMTAALSEVSIPWFLMTGTKDDSPIGDMPAASRLEVYAALPVTVDRYQLVFDGGEHHAFGGVSNGTGRLMKRRDPDHHPAIQALSTAFFDTYLREDPAAREWLQGDGPRAMLDPLDAWDAEPSREAGDSSDSETP